MAVEQKRGCGYRKAGSLYIVGTGLGVGCHRLPVELHVCPTCSAGIKFSRGWTWVKPKTLLGTCAPGLPKGLAPMEGVKYCECPAECPVCFPTDDRAGLLWVGHSFYTPESFIEEAERLGVSKKISTLPRGYKPGETWVYLAHKKAVPVQKRLAGCEDVDSNGDAGKPGIFYAFNPTGFEKIVKASKATKTEIEKLEKRGIKAVVVPDDDPDHCG